MITIVIITALIILLLTIVVISHAKLREKITLDNSIKQENERISTTNAKLLQELTVNTTKYNNLVKDIEALTQQKQSLDDDIATSKEHIDLIQSIAANAIEKNAEQLSAQAEADQEEAREAYQKVLAQMAQDYQSIQAEEAIKIANAQEELNELHEKLHSLKEEQRRAAQERANQDFYRLCLNDDDIAEVAKIKSILPYIRDKEVLCKLIWSSYYMRPAQEMVARQFGKRKVCGIYKITSLLDGKSYIGQSVDIGGQRWFCHIRRGLGAEPATKNKLYPTMNKQGPENFTFELLEECSKEKLDEREKFYIAFYQTDTELNATIGG